MTAKQLRASILQLAVQGKLVPQDPADEPASELLARIRAEKARLVKEGKLKKEKNSSEIFVGSDGATYEKFADGTTKDISDEIPFDMPRGWIWVRLPAIASILYGYPFDSQKFNSIGEGVPLIRIRDVLSGTTKTFTTEDCPERYIIHNGDMLVGMDGNFNVSFWKGGPAYLNQRVCRISALGTNELQRFLFYYLPFVFERIENSASFVTVKHLSDKHLSAALIPLPPRPEQKRIVEKIENLLPRLDEYDKAQTAAATYEAAFPDAFRKSILQAAVQGKLVAQIPTDEPAEEMLARLHKTDGSSLVQTKRGKGKTTPSRIFRGSDKRTYETRNGETVCIDDELPFEIPSNWTWARLSSLGRFHGGHTPSMADPSLWGGDILWVSSKDMKGNEIVDTEDKITDKGARSLEMVMPGSLVMVTRSGILKHTFPVAIVRIPCTINQDLRAFVPRFPELVTFLFWTLKGMQKWILEDFRKAGTTVQSITWDRFVEMPVPIPPLAEQKRIVARIEELLEAVTRLQTTPA